MHLLDPKFPTDYNSSTTGFQVEKVRHIVYLCENNKKQIGTLCIEHGYSNSNT